MPAGRLPTGGLNWSSAMTRLFMTIAILTCLRVVSQPMLWFSEQDIPALRGSTQASEHEATFRTILQNARTYCDPTKSGYADPEDIDEHHGPVARPQVLAHAFGRRLTDWSETIGFAYQMTGEEALGKHGALVLETACRKLPVSDPRVAKSFAGARGDIMRGLAVGYDWLGEAMSPRQRDLWMKTSTEYLENILAEARREKTWWVPYHNFMGVAVGASGCLALELRQAGLQEAQGRLDECARMVSRWLDEGFDEQGAYYEGTGYAVYGLSNAVLFADALGRSGGPDLLMHPRLRRVPGFFAMSVLPGERVLEARNDASYAGLSNPLILRLAGAHQSGLARWLWERCGGGVSPFSIVWDNSVEPQSPEEGQQALAEHFEGRGLCVFRTGWAKTDVMFSLEAGPYKQVTHNQADKGHFTLYGLGHRWAIDSGYGNNREPGGRDQTVAHNCVLVDGQGQALSGAGAGTNGDVLAYVDAPRYGYALTDATDAYNRNNHGQPGATVHHALRHAVFVRPQDGLPAYAVVLDDIGKDEAEHDYTWLLHTSSAMGVELGEDGRAQLRPEEASGGAFVGTPAEATTTGDVTWQLDVGSEGDYAVWARVRAAGDTPPRSDSFFVRMDDGTQVAWHMPSRRDWSWGRVSSGVAHEPVTFHLTPGTHRLCFATREPGAQVDRLIVTDAATESLSLEDLGQGIAMQAETGRVRGAMQVVKVTGEGGDPRLMLAISAGRPVALSQDMYDGHPRLRASTRAINPRFAAVLAPLPAGTERPRVSFDRGETHVNVRILWKGREDTVSWRGKGATKPTVELRGL